MGESASLARSCVLSYANDPFLRVIDHSHELTEDVFVRVVDFLEFRVPDIAVAKCKLDVDLRLSGLAFRIVQPGNESRRVTPVAPRFSDSILIVVNSSALSARRVFPARDPHRPFLRFPV
jgi:hypothetical protein